MHADPTAIELSAAQVREQMRRGRDAELMAPEQLSALLWRVSTSHANAEAALARMADPDCRAAMSRLEAELRCWRQQLHGELLRRCGGEAAPRPAIN